MSSNEGWELVVDGIDFGEGPRWHLGRLWFGTCNPYLRPTVTVFVLNLSCS